MGEAPDEAFREAPPASEAPSIIHLPPPTEPTASRSMARRRKAETRRGRHFGPRPVEDPLDAWLPPTRCTRAQRDQADGAAKAAGMSLNGYVRLRMFGSAGPRVHRNPSEAIKMLSQILGQMGRPGSNLNQGSRALNQISIAAGEGEGRDRLAELIEEMAELHRQAIAEHRECVAAVLRALGQRPDADHY
jgi:hypothetical protein